MYYYATKQLNELSAGQMKMICKLNSLVLLCPELCAITLEKAQSFLEERQ